MSLTCSLWRYLPSWRPPPLLGCHLILSVILGGPGALAGEGRARVAPTVPEPNESCFQFAYETAVNFGVNNPNHYVSNPQFLSLRWQPRPTEEFFHTRILFTQQFEATATAVPFWRGAENYYFGFGVGTRLIYSLRDSRWSVFVGGRLLVGFIDSTGSPYGQGQDLTFSPTVSGGVLYRVNDKQRVGLSLLYQHFSNAGMSEPEAKNVGLNTLGPMVEWNVAF